MRMTVMTTYRDANYALAQKSAYDLLETLGISNLPISVKKVIRVFPNLHLQRYDQYAKSLQCSEQEVAKLLQSDDGALWYNADDNDYIIFYNAKIDSKERIRFTLAHELGHYILRHNEESNETIVSRYLLPEGKYRIYEREANYFAKRFLAPVPVIDGFLSYNNYRIDQFDIESIFNVSFSVSGHIIDDLNRRKQYGLHGVKTKLTNQFDLLNFGLAKTTTCKTCNYLLLKDTVICPICGTKQNPQYINYLFLSKGWRNNLMNYKKPCRLDKGGKAIICPVCGNEEITNGPICPICGTYLINKCSGCSVTSEFDDIDDIKYACLESPNGCNMLLPSNARYCTQCGCMSTFYLQDVLSDYTEEFKLESDSKLKAI